jgi:hypothetical protein
MKSKTTFFPHMLKQIIEEVFAFNYRLVVKRTGRTYIVVINPCLQNFLQTKFPA